MTAVLSRVRGLARADEGVTLAEMIVVFLVTTLVLVALGNMYVGTIRTQQVIGDLSSAANGAQLSARSIDDGVRNAVDLRIEDAPSGDAQLVLACTAGSAAAIEYAWTAWHYSPHDGGEIRTRTFPADAAPAFPTAATAATWTLLLDGVRPVDGALPAGDVFGVDPADPDPAEPSILLVAFDALADDDESTRVEFATTLAPHAEPTPGEERCS